MIQKLNKMFVVNIGLIPISYNVVVEHNENVDIVLKYKLRDNIGGGIYCFASIKIKKVGKYELKFFIKRSWEENKKLLNLINVEIKA